ncbi:hypothetical protein ACE6H2_023573 [Prunus campanulata]
MNRPIFSNLGASGAFGPQSRRATNLTSTEGRKVLMTLSKPNVVLANAVEGLKVLWNTIRAPTFDPVEDHDTLSKIQPLLCQIAEEEVALKGEISADLKLKAELDAKMADIRARIAASEPAVQDLTSRTFRARLASKKLTSTRRALDLDMDNLSDLISTILEFIA